MERLLEVRDAYEAISRIYPETREGGLLARELLKRVGDLIRGLNPRIVLDIGAGAGGNLEVTRDFLGNTLYVGCELSMGMIKASRQPIDWINCSGTHLPLRDGFADLVISLAVIHHIPKELITDFLENILRVLRAGGLFIATAWGCTEDVASRMRVIRDCEGYLPWRYGLREAVDRYYRLYNEEELVGEVADAGFNVIGWGTIKIGGNLNHYVVAKK